ncbi:hypothetical protein [Ramlibacter sp. PS4R-6]|uniref:hypothetical protein n=1 Tax=Ramlibacter sp. PS4R-6 TaxID=3133438 RepID=UPI00309BDD58
MNLVVASRHETPLMRFVVEGPWEDGDALKLAYFIKAAIARVREERVLLDLRRVKTPPGSQGKFLICDRLRRALYPHVRIGLVTPPELVEPVPPAANDGADVAVFSAEHEALRWLRVPVRA